jgi:hypothetical protein
MYLFMSALFFLVFFTVEGTPSANGAAANEKLDGRERLALASVLRTRLQKHPGDTSLQGRIARLSDTTRPARLDDIDPGGGAFFSLNGRHYHSVAEYDSIQKALPSKDRDNWLVHRLNVRGLEIDEKYKDRQAEAGQAVIDKFYHRLPYLFFFSLPFFAMILKLLYIRRRNFYYSDHAVFTLYHYIFSFLLLLVMVALGGLRSWTGWDWMGYVITATFFVGPVYLFIEMKNFYRQGIGKTIGKFLLLNLLGAIVVVILFLAFLFFSIFQI